MDLKYSYTYVGGMYPETKDYHHGIAWSLVVPQACLLYIQYNTKLLLIIGFYKLCSLQQFIYYI